MLEDLAAFSMAGTRDELANIGGVRDEVGECDGLDAPACCPTIESCTWAGAAGTCDELCNTGVECGDGLDATAGVTLEAAGTSGDDLKSGGVRDEVCE